MDNLISILIRGLAAALATAIITAPVALYKAIKDNTLDKKIAKKCTPKKLSVFISEEEEKKFVKYNGVYYRKKEVYTFVVDYFSTKSKKAIEKEIARTEKILLKDGSNGRYYKVKLKALRNSLG